MTFGIYRTCRHPVPDFPILKCNDGCFLSRGLVVGFVLGRFANEMSGMKEPNPDHSRAEFETAEEAAPWAEKLRIDNPNHAFEVREIP